MPFKYNGQGVSMDNDFEPVPVGEYTLVIQEAELKATKIKEDGTGGYPMVSMKLEIDDVGPYLGRKVWHNVTFLPAKDKDGKARKGAGIALHFLHAISQPYSTEKEFDINEQDWIGRRFRATLKIEDGFNGKKRNSIGYVITEEPAGSETPFD